MGVTFINQVTLMPNQNLVSPQCPFNDVTGMYPVVKRLMDIIGAAVALVLLAPFLVLVAMAIRLESPGPALFKQTRVGLNGRQFTLWKFRSMRQDAEARRADLDEQNEMVGGVTFKIKTDPRITQTGKWIRKLSIDELPQLWNVLMGDMSLVGPRPAVPSEVAQYTAYESRRLLAMPGLTCIWQVSGRSDLPFDVQVQLDIDYLYRRSVVYDLWLIVATIPVVLTGRGAY